MDGGIASYNAKNSAVASSRDWFLMRQGESRVRYVKCAGFRLPGARSRYVIPMPVDWKNTSARTFGDLLASECQLTPEQVRSYFLMMNYLKFRASTAKGTKADEFKRQALEVRELLVLSHQRLVGYIAKRLGRKLRPSEDLMDVVSVGQVTLICCVDKFNAERGPSFSAYLFRAIEGGCRRFIRDGRRKGGVLSGDLEIDEAQIPFGDERTENDGSDVSQIMRDAGLTEKMIWAVETHYGYSGPRMTKTEMARAAGIGTNSVNEMLKRAFRHLKRRFAAKVKSRKR